MPLYVAIKHHGFFPHERWSLLYFSSLTAITPSPAPLCEMVWLAQPVSKPEVVNILTAAQQLYQGIAAETAHPFYLQGLLLWDTWPISGKGY